MTSASLKDSSPHVYEANNHSFILKVWIEETTKESKCALWRGKVTHVQSGKMVYVQDLDNLSAFVAPYLDELGVNLGIAWRVKQWLRQRNLRLKT